MIKTDVLVIGAGPVGLFAVHQLGIIGLKAEVVDNLDKIGGQCIELYPDKPIYDIPAIPECTGETLTKNLLEQIKPFKTNFHLNERVQEISKENNNWKIITSKEKIFIAPNIIIAGGVGSFEPRKFSVKEAEKFENNGVYYSIKDKKYHRKQFIGEFELTSLIGNITLKEGLPFSHTHITFSDTNYNVFGGHLFDAKITAAGEFIVQFGFDDLNRKMDRNIGLPLWCLEECIE